MPFSSSWSLPFRFWTNIFYALHVILPISNTAVCFKVGSSEPVFLNRRAAAQYRALASIIPARERFSRNLSF
jgi:hypothetical protein